MLRLLICIAVVWPCFSNAEDSISQLHWLYEANPDQDFQTAIKSKDYRFYGVYGVAPYVPGPKNDCLTKNAGIKYIQGTSDALENYEHAKLNAIAIVYAQTYNYLIFKHLYENKIFNCVL